MEELLNSIYRQGQVADNSIGPLEIRVVKTGTFEELMDYVDIIKVDFFITKGRERKESLYSKRNLNQNCIK